MTRQRPLGARSARRPSTDHGRLGFRRTRLPPAALVVRRPADPPREPRSDEPPEATRRSLEVRGDPSAGSIPRAHGPEAASATDPPRTLSSACSLGARPASPGPGVRLGFGGRPVGVRQDSGARGPKVRAGAPSPVARERLLWTCATIITRPWRSRRKGSRRPSRRRFPASRSRSRSTSTAAGARPCCRERRPRRSSARTWTRRTRC